MSAPLFSARSALLGGLSAVIMLAAPALALADDGRAARLTVAQAYVSATLEDMDLDELVRSMYRPLLAQIRAGGQEVSAEQEAEIEALYLQELTGPMRNMLRAQDEIMADLLTLPEIEALYAFYNTPTGRTVLQKLPQIVEAQMPITMAMIEDRMEVIVPRMMEILD